jgi:hypothetical protein
VDTSLDFFEKLLNKNAVKVKPKNVYSAFKKIPTSCNLSPKIIGKNPVDPPPGFSTTVFLIYKFSK